MSQHSHRWQISFESFRKHTETHRKGLSLITGPSCEWWCSDVVASMTSSEFISGRREYTPEREEIFVRWIRTRYPPPPLLWLEHDNMNIKLLLRVCRVHHPSSALESVTFSHEDYSVSSVSFLPSNFWGRVYPPLINCLARYSHFTQPQKKI